MGNNGVSFHSPKYSSPSHTTFLPHSILAQTETDNRLIWENITTTAAGFKQKRLTDADTDCMTSECVRRLAQRDGQNFCQIALWNLGFWDWMGAQQRISPSSNLFPECLLVPVPESPQARRRRQPEPQGGMQRWCALCAAAAESDLIGLVSE